MRSPEELSKQEKEKIRGSVHREAEQHKWHTLNNKEKSKLYNEWSVRFNINREYLKDRIMKGFDVRQGIPLKGEPKIQKEIEDLLQKNGISILSQFVVAGKYRVDLVFGFYKDFPTHVVEIERADSWLKGFTQVLGYTADYFQDHEKLIQPVLILFGNVSSKKLEKIKNTCDFARVVLCYYNLNISGPLKVKVFSLDEYLGLSIGRGNEK